MSEVTPTPPKKVAKPKSDAKAHPTFTEMVIEAIARLRNPKGSTRPAIKKWIVKHYRLEDTRHNAIFVNKALKKGVERGTLVTARGHAGTYKTAAATTTRDVKKTSKVVKKTPKKVVKNTSEKVVTPKVGRKSPSMVKTEESPALKKRVGRPKGTWKTAV